MQITRTVWTEHSLREAPSDRRTTASRRIRWPMDARIVRLALACCSVGVARAAVAQDTLPETIPWNLLGSIQTYVRAESDSGTVFFQADGSDKIPAGSTSFVIEGDSCWTYEWCKGGTCGPTGNGSLEFAIAPQAIVVTFDGNLPTLPSGLVTFAIDVLQPTTVTWPGRNKRLGVPDRVQRALHAPFDRYVPAGRDAGWLRLILL
jgi:hypothetical protein